MLEVTNGGTELISVTRSAKYVVKESLDDILARLTDNGMAIRDAKNTASTMEVENNENYSI
jgi:hypothetical protein